MSYYQHLAAFFAIMSVVFLLIGCYHRRSNMQPRSYTILSAVGPHSTVVLYPQPFGKGIDSTGNTYRILGDTAHIIEENIR